MGKKVFIYLETQSSKGISYRKVPVDVSDRIYYEYMRTVWREQKHSMRHGKCRRSTGGLCADECEFCHWYNRDGNSLSTDEEKEHGEYIRDHVTRLIDQSSPVEKAILYKEKIEKLRSCIALLDQREQDIIQLCFWECCTERDIAERLGISQATVNRRKKSALEKLREYLTGE